MSNIHFIAIGGSIMSNLAIALKKQGHTITGSDDAITGTSLTELSKHHLFPDELGWNADKISNGIDKIILGMHAKVDNPELLKAQELNIPIVSYPEYLYEQNKEKTRVVIAGSHGKTTITAMVLHALQFHGTETNFMVGAKLPEFDCMVNLDEANDFMVFEGDEYPSSPMDPSPKFLHYRPTIALISGVSWDHINVYPTKEDYINQFRKFIASITPGGALIYNQDDEVLVQLVEEAGNYFRKFPYSIPENSVINGETYIATEMGDMPLLIFGEHNLRNLEGAKYICQQMGMLEEEFYEAIMSFRGANLRMQKVAHSTNAQIYRDFAHAPSKVNAATDAFTKQFKNLNTSAILELHTFSSLTPEFIDFYKNSLNPFDQAAIYYSEEVLATKNQASLSDDELKSKFNRSDLNILRNKQDLRTYWEGLNKENSAILLMSSGNFGQFDFEN